jgi:hypothetical protein
VLLPKMLDAKPFYFFALSMLIVLLLLATRQPVHQSVNSPRSKE